MKYTEVDNIYCIAGFWMNNKKKNKRKQRWMQMYVAKFEL